MVYPGLREEFRLRRLGFGGVKGERLCHSQWRVPVLLYLIYRFLLMAYGVFWLGFVSVHRGNPPQPWGAYLTIWTYVLLNIYLIAHFLAAFLHHVIRLYRQSSVIDAGTYLCSQPSAAVHARMFTELGAHVMGDYEAIPGNEETEEEVSLHPPLYLCAVWVLNSIVSSAALMVTIVFFLFLFPGLSDYPNISLENLQEHLLNSVIVVVEHLVSAMPCRLLHLVYPLLYGLVYITFSVVYWAQDHDHVMYPILDWNKPGPTLGYVLMVGFVFIPILHLLFFIVHKAKLAIYHRVSC